MKSIVAILCTILMVSAPASAEDLSLGKKETHRVVEFLLSAHIGPAISSSTSDPKTHVWGCKAKDRFGSCHGSVVGGTVVCKGVFKVRKKGKQLYSAWPVTMTCEDRAG